MREDRLIKSHITSIRKSISICCIFVFCIAVSYGHDKQSITTSPPASAFNASYKTTNDQRQLNILTFAQRIECQRAIEEVYYNHRIWPKENPASKPLFSDVLPQKAIIDRVEDYLRKSEALQHYWNQPLTPAMLQEEIDRMARETKNPVMLKELWESLYNDPYLIAECIARPLLADRLIHALYARDPVLHAQIKARAESDLQIYNTPDSIHLSSGHSFEVIFINKEANSISAQGKSKPQTFTELTFEEWQNELMRQAQI